MARRNKKRDDEPRGNLTAETFREHVDNIKEALANKDSAVAALRTTYKNAQSVGINTRVLREALSIEKQDRHSQRGDFNERATYLLWLRTPIGQQLQLIPDEPFEEDERPAAPAEATAH